MEKGLCIKYFEEDCELKALDSSPDGKYIATGDREGRIKIWNTKTWKCVNSFKAHNQSVNFLSFSSNGEILASAGDNIINLWKSENWEYITTFTGHTSPVNTLSFSPDGKFLASGDEEGMIKIWNTGAGAGVKEIKAPSSVKSIKYSLDGKYLFAITLDSFIILWDIDTDNLIKISPEHSDFITSLNLSPDGKYIISGSKVHDYKTL